MAWARASWAKLCGVSRSMFRENWSSTMITASRLRAVASQWSRSPRAADACSGPKVSAICRSKAASLVNQRRLWAASACPEASSSPNQNDSTSWKSEGRTGLAARGPTTVVQLRTRQRVTSPLRT